MEAVEQFSDYLRACYAPQPAPRLVIGRDVAHLEVEPAFAGLTPDGQRIAIVDPCHRERPAPAPATFRVCAIMPVFNEADVVRHTLEYLTDDGIGVYVIDNWSTDATLDIVNRFEGRGLLGVERFPPDDPPETYDLRAILGRVEQVATSLDADWLILHDADERRRTPWPDVSLRGALHHFQGLGFSCIDHVTLNFWPVDDDYTPDDDLETYFCYFEFSAHAGHFHQRRAWKNTGQSVSLAPTAGHDVQFDGRRVAPYKFLLKHYPLRSRRQAERKVRDERRARWNAEERSLGWHQQYDGVERFIRDPRELERFDPRTFYAHHLLERLSGVGIFAEPPAWATPPLWRS